MHDTAAVAAQYVRMSADHQRYSTENQTAAIAEYAAAHSLQIAHTYADEARSGLTIRRRLASSPTARWRWVPARCRSPARRSMCRAPTVIEFTTATISFAGQAFDVAATVGEAAASILRKVLRPILRPVLKPPSDSDAG
jgi:hypothetical protein